MWREFRTMVTSGSCSFPPFNSEAQTLLADLPQGLLSGVERYNESLRLYASIARRVLARVFLRKQGWLHSKFGITSYLLKESLSAFQCVDPNWELISSVGQDSRKVQVVCLRSHPRLTVIQTVVCHTLFTGFNTFATSLRQTETRIRDSHRVTDPAFLQPGYYIVHNQPQWAWDEMVYWLTLQSPENFHHTHVEYYDTSASSHNLALVCHPLSLQTLSMATQIAFAVIPNPPQWPDHVSYPLGYMIARLYMVHTHPLELEWLTMRLRDWIRTSPLCVEGCAAQDEDCINSYRVFRLDTSLPVKADEYGFSMSPRARSKFVKGMDYYLHHQWGYNPRWEYIHKVPWIISLLLKCPEFTPEVVPTLVVW